MKRRRSQQHKNTRNVKKPAAAASSCVIPYGSAKRVNFAVQKLINDSIFHGNYMIDDTVEQPVKILMFLDAQGKCYIDEIHDMLHKTGIPVIFVSSQLESGNHTTTDDQSCVVLARFFEVLDPLGGGKYPINCIAVVADDRIRAAVPLRLCHRRGHEKFGVSLHDMAMFVQEVVASISV